MISEIELYGMLNNSKKEFHGMQKKYKMHPTEQLKLDLSSKYLEIKIIQAKIRNLRH
jgi:hypothetical protein